MRVDAIAMALLCLSVLSCDRALGTGDAGVDLLPIDGPGLPIDLSAEAEPDMAMPLDLATPTDLEVNDGGGAMLGQLCGQSANGLGCIDGLACCYPCGHPGCMYVCQTPCQAGPGCHDGCLLIP